MDLNKRKFMFLSSLAFATPSLLASPATADTDQSVEDGDVSFQWHHRESRLYGQLSAPTRGWIAVGFNRGPGIAGTYFLMASVAGPIHRIEERFAIAPEHIPITDQGWLKTVQLHDGGFQRGASSVAFSVSTETADKDRITLQPGGAVHLMLAWSHQADFDHHPAWRKHYQIV